MCLFVQTTLLLPAMNVYVCIFVCVCVRVRMMALVLLTLGMQRS